MNPKKWTAILLFSSFIIIGTIGLVNYIVDPLWNFSHSNVFNAKQKGFNERQQKTNYIYFNDNLEFDSVLLGSSRSAIINRHEFDKMKVYNYSVASLKPYEYKYYIDFSKKVHTKELKNIIIGIDFFGTKKPAYKDTKVAKIDIDNTLSFAYRYKMLFSKSSFMQSIENLKIAMFGRDRYYDRDNIDYPIIISQVKRTSRYKKHLKKHLIVLTGDNYTYDDNYINYIKELKNENKTTKFIIFTSPITASLLVSIVRDINRVDDYERWLREVISVFGEIHHFQTINSITTKIENYSDDDHYYDYIGKLVANKLSNIDNPNVPNDFGIILDKDNIDLYIQEFKKQIKNFKFDEEGKIIAL